MAAYLLDTHVLLWWLSQPSALSAEARGAIADGSSALYFSAAGAWELAIKRTFGRLHFPANLAEVLGANRIDVLPVTLAHALAVADLPLHHRDPFDRMQIAQARLENLVVITRDPMFTKYDVRALAG